MGVETRTEYAICAQIPPELGAGIRIWESHLDYAQAESRFKEIYTARPDKDSRFYLAKVTYEPVKVD